MSITEYIDWWVATPPTSQYERHDCLVEFVANHMSDNDLDVLTGLIEAEYNNETVKYQAIGRELYESFKAFCEEQDDE